MLVDLIKQEITGQDAEDALSRANITVNKNAVPNDPRPPRVTSGLRIGTPAITTRGFKEAETAQLTGWIADVLDELGNPTDIDTVVSRIRADVLELCGRYPVYA
jgi:glycine hydroxymethyltransferase